MTKDEFLQGIYILENSYQGFKISDKKDTLKIWYELFKEDSERLFALGIKQHLATSKFVPTIASLRECMQEITNPAADITPEQAWGEALGAIQHCGSYAEERAYERMSPITQDIVRAMGYRQMCLSENIMAERAHFLRMFDAYKARSKKLHQLPQSLKDESAQFKRLTGAVQAIGQKMAMPKVSGEFEKGRVETALFPEEDPEELPL